MSEKKYRCLLREEQAVFHVRANCLDDLMRAVFTRLLSNHRENYIVSSRKGTSTEIFGALLELTNPRARLSRSKERARVFSPLGELAWYLAKSDSIDFIQFYLKDYSQHSDDGLTANGAYGPGLFGNAEMSTAQWDRVINTLRERPGSRNAVIQIFSNSDAEKESKDIPCTCTMQFAVRNSRLNLHVHMRSNDAVLGLPHDVFSFSMLQEIAARQLGYEIGKYQHSVASLHLYKDTDELQSTRMAKEFVREGFHEVSPMPSMPKGDPWPALKEIVVAEREIRSGNYAYWPDRRLDPYWSDLILLLKIYEISKLNDNKISTLNDHVDEVNRLMGSLSSPTYKLYVLDRIERTLSPSRTLFDLLNE